MKKVFTTEFDEAKRQLTEKAYDAFGRGIEIYVNDSYLGEPVTVTVNWAAMGATTVDETRRFASQLEQAAEMAAAFPYAGYTLSRDEADYYEDMYYYIEDEDENEQEDEDEQEASCEDIEDEDKDGDYIAPEVRDEWSRSGSYDTLIVEIERPRGDGLMDRIVPDAFLEDIDGLGTARAFADELGAEYDEEPGRIDINIALNRIYDICRDYDEIRTGTETALSKHGMAQAWARAIDAELVEDEFDYVQKADWMQSMEYAEGQLAGWDVTVIYVKEKEDR